MSSKRGHQNLTLSVICHNKTLKPHISDKSSFVCNSTSNKWTKMKGDIKHVLNLFLHLNVLEFRCTLWTLCWLQCNSKTPTHYPMVKPFCVDERRILAHVWWNCIFLVSFCTLAYWKSLTLLYCRPSLWNIKAWLKTSGCIVETGVHFVP